MANELYSNESPLQRYARELGRIDDSGLSPLERYAQSKNNTNSNSILQAAQANALANQQNSINTTEVNKGGIGGGLGYVASEAGLGFVRSLEGITDFLAAGAVELFGNDELADEIMKNDWMNYNSAKEKYNPNTAMGFVGDISGGIGGMIPSLALSLIPGAGAALSVGATAASAAGQGVSGTAKESGTAGGKEWAYGALTGAVEAAIEKVGGSALTGDAGKLLGKQIGKNAATKVGVSMVGEGLEEVASEILDPALKRVSGVDKNATVDWASLPRTFAVGGAVGGVMEGASTGINSALSGGYNNYQAGVRAQELSDVLTESNTRQAQGKKTIYSEKDITDAAQRLSNNLQKMDETTRTKYLDSNPFMRSYFAEDGTVLNNRQGSASTNRVAPTTYSASLQGRESTLAYAPSTRATTVSQDAMRTISTLTKGKAEVVLTDHDFGTTADGHRINGEYRNGIIYLNAKSTVAEQVNFVAKHELVHTLEGTKDYSVLGDYIEEAIAKNSALAKKYNIGKYLEAYANSQDVTLNEETKLYEATTEMYADFIANEVLTSQEAVNRLAKRDANIVKRFLNWVRDALKRFSMSKSNRAQYDELRRIEKALSRALDSAQGGITLTEIDEAVSKAKEEKAKEAVAAKEAETETETKPEIVTEKKTESVKKKVTEKVQEAKDKMQVGGKLATARYSFSSISQSFGVKDADGKVTPLSLVDMQERKYKESEDYKKYVDECVDNMIQSQPSLVEKRARETVETSIDGIVDVAIAMKLAGYDILDTDNKGKLRDSKKRRLFSSLEPNSDYFTSNDISTICDKRKNFTAIYEDIVAREEEMGVPPGKRFFDNIDNYFVLHDMLAEKGLTAACKQCYVESMRKNLAPMADSFIELLQEKDENNKKNRSLYDWKGKLKENNAELRKKLLAQIDEEHYEITADTLTVKMLTTADGLATLKINAPLIYEAFNSYYGQSKPKMPKKAVPFRFGELSAMLRKHDGTINQNLVDRINSTGGFRLQSYSDFQIENTADVLQVIFEAGTLGLKGHAYTKVPAFLDVTKNTNLKRNISVFMYRYNNEWHIDKKDSFPGKLNQIYDIVKEDKSGNTGIIAVSQNADMSAWAMANEQIAYIIPFHKSGIKMATVRNTEVTHWGRKVKGYLGIKDHTRQQSEVWAKGADKGKKVKKPINIYEFWDFNNARNLSQKKLIEKNVKEYIDRCEKAGYLPKFREYLVNESLSMENESFLEKVVEYEHKFGNKNATVEDISFKYKGYTIPYGYYKVLIDFGLFKPDGKASPQKVLSLKDYDFDEAVKRFGKPKELRRTEVLQQFDNETERDKYRDSDLTTEELQAIVDQKRKEIADEVIEKKYGKKGESRLSVDVDNFDVSLYNEITLPVQERNRVQSEVLKWSNKRNVPLRVHLANDYTYLCMLDEDAEIHIYDKFKGKNIHELGDGYDNKIARPLNRAIEIVRIKQRSNGISNNSMPNGRGDRGTNTIDNRKVRQEGQRNGRGYRQNDNDVSGNKERKGIVYFDASKEESRKSLAVTSQEDAEYMDAYYDGDDDLMQELVDRVANRLGYKYKAYHHTENAFTEFDLEKARKNMDIQGFYFSADMDAESEYGSVRYDTYLKMENPYVVDSKEMQNAIPFDMSKPNAGVIAREWLLSKGYDSVIRKAEYFGAAADEYIVLKPSQIKSAEAITYADDVNGEGDVIPLSQRFNPKKSDIRYSINVNNKDANAKQVKKGKKYKLRKPTYMSDAEYQEYLDNVFEEGGDESVAEVTTVVTPDQKPTTEERIKAVKNKVADKWLDTKMRWTNIHAGIEQEAKRLGGNVEASVHKARASRAAAINMLTNEQRDFSGKNRVGDSLAAIFKPIQLRGEQYAKDFNTYLYHMHNIDRMSFEATARAEISALLSSDAELAKLVKQKNLTEDERTSLLRKTENGRKYLALLDNKNKPVFGKTVTADDSKKAVAEMEAAHPEFKVYAKKVWNYSKNLIQYRVDAGLITKELADTLLKRYPHYVPTYRTDKNMSSSGISKTKKGLKVKETVKTAKGSNLDLEDISLALSYQTMDVVRAAAMNNLATELHDLAEKKGDFSNIALQENPVKLEEDMDFLNDRNAGEVLFYKDGMRYKMAVSQPIAEGFDAFFPASYSNDALANLLAKGNTTFKGLVTQWNPLFGARNAIRDIQEALFYTKYGTPKFSAAVAKAYKQIITKGEMYQRFLAAGGLEAGYFAKETGIYDKRSKGKKAIAKTAEKLQSLNEIIETAPRLAEFMLAIESGKTDAQALLESAEVTTNFSRGGKWSKMLNRTVMPFLNPSIQGWSKLWRTVAGKKTAKQWAHLIVKSIAVGMAVGMFNDLLNGDDEDYQKLNMRDKENYYIIRIGDGKFLKLPKGRVVAALGSVVTRTNAAMNGDEHAFEGWGESVLGMVTPVEQFSRTIFSPITDAKTNTTWYGSNIESESMQNYAVKDRYDEATSSIAIWIGQKLNYSPKKVHYIIDQYTGVIGDVLLPFTSEKAERGMFTSAFSIDSVSSNRISTEFYNMKDEMMYGKNAGDMYADMVYTYLNRVSTDVSEMYDEKRRIQNDSSLSYQKKIEQSNIVQELINDTLQAAMINAETFEQILMDMGYTDALAVIINSNEYKNMDEDTQKKVAQRFKTYSYQMAMSTLTGEKTEGKYYLYNAVGAEKTAIYLTEINDIEADEDKKGNVTKTRKEKVHKYIESQKLSKEQKYILMYLAGYKPNDEGKAYVEKYLKKNGFTAKELEKLWD